MTKNKKRQPDIISPESGKFWIYSRNVMEHFFHPRNFFSAKDLKTKWDGFGQVGSPACGDIMRLWLKIDKKTEKIKKCRWQTYGCASAIASTSMLSQMLTSRGGMTLKKAIQLKPQDIIQKLGGLPTRKIHCSVLGDKALVGAINDYFVKTKQLTRIIDEGARVVCPVTRTTNRQIEELVKNGKTTLKQIQENTKAGVGNPYIEGEISQLIHFYLLKNQIQANAKTKN